MFDYETEMTLKDLEVWCRERRVELSICCVSGSWRIHIRRFEERLPCVEFIRKDETPLARLLANALAYYDVMKPHAAGVVVDEKTLPSAWKENK